MNSGTISDWKVTDQYDKKGGGTITARFGFTYKGSSHTGGWFDQGPNTTKSTWWNNFYISTCEPIVGWMQVSGQQTFNNAPVTAC
ncbi:hypothetical protein ACIQV3_39835 [Streptomyces sp. NPDC099050]|uniref:hypothetical protein n=1 Tax=Streptomyces sp. NPDC099050 TaxID=3366100 RepID=UPI0037F39373